MAGNGNTVNGEGNALNNVILGGTGKNELQGHDGNDNLIGIEGNDTPQGRRRQ